VYKVDIQNEPTFNLAVEAGRAKIMSEYKDILSTLINCVLQIV